LLPLAISTPALLIRASSLVAWHRSIPHQGGDSVGRLVGRVQPCRGSIVFHAKVDGSAFGVGHGDRDCDQVIVGQTFPIALELDR
jgi:hypothetical protein